MKTMGKFYRELILTRSDLSPREFPDFEGESQVVRDLFGWKLYSGKEYIECRSHEEARLLKIFFDLGMETVQVPSDDNYLKTILPRLEKFKKYADEVIAMYAESLMNWKLKEQLRRTVYHKLLTR
jgi:hypothetical protein